MQITAAQAGQVAEVARCRRKLGVIRLAAARSARSIYLSVCGRRQGREDRKRNRPGAYACGCHCIKRFKLYCFIGLNKQERNKAKPPKVLICTPKVGQTFGGAYFHVKRKEV